MKYQTVLVKRVLVKEKWTDNYLAGHHSLDRRKQEHEFRGGPSVSGCRHISSNKKCGAAGRCRDPEKSGLHTASET